MASIISAGTTSGTALNMSGDTSGNLAFQTQAGANTITVANQTGTLNVAGPAFSAYASSAQTIADGTFTKLQFNTKTFDTATCFNTSNYRFTPTVAGYYQVNGSWYCSVSSGQIISGMYKNGTLYQMAAVGATSQGVVIPVSSLIYMNGSTDYVELYVYQNASTTFNTIGNRPDLYYFQAALVRGA